ncbi:unnamed protein product [Rotaria sp. Silwood2]|nr:unnamed protein product [Rotaria sp. Silwood2]
MLVNIYIHLLDFDIVYNPSSTLNKRHHDFDSSLDGSDDDEDEVPPIVSKKRPDINDSSKMLNKLLSRKKAPAKKKKKTTTIIDDSTDVECKGCSILREELNKFQKRLERVERVIPAIGLNTPGTTNTTPSLPKIEEINQNIKDDYLDQRVIIGDETNGLKYPFECDELGDDLVADFLTHVPEHSFFGWLYTYLSSSVIDPERTLNNGSSERPNLVALTCTPDDLNQTHSSALGVAFYTGQQFLGRY